MASRRGEEALMHEACQNRIRTSFGLAQLIGGKRVNACLSGPVLVLDQRTRGTIYKGLQNRSLPISRETQFVKHSFVSFAFHLESKCRFL